VASSALSDEATVYDVITELQNRKGVSDATFERALARFGEHGVMDLFGICGYYTVLAMVMNGAQTPPPASDAAPLP